MQPCIAEGLGGQSACLGCFQTASVARAHRFSRIPSLLAAAFPEHFSAIGANAIAIYDAANCWVQDVSGAQTGVAETASFFIAAAQTRAWSFRPAWLSR